MGIDLNKLAQFWLAREHARGPDAAAEQAAEAASTEQLVKKAQLAKALQELQFGASDRALRTRLTEAQIRNYDEPNRVPSTVKPPDIGSFTDYVVRKYGSSPTPAQIEEARKVYQQADDRPRSGGGDGAAANPFNMLDGQGNLRAVVRGKDGALHFVTKVDGMDVSPGPTADMRNNDQQAQAVDPAFDLVSKSLDNLEASTRGFGGSLSALVPGTNAYYAKDHFIKQATALLGAITARQAGEGSRLSDEDRKAYSQASTLVNNAILLPGGVEEARKRLTEAKGFLDTVIARRRMGGMAPMPAHTAPGAPAGNRRIKFDAQGNVIQ